MRTSVVCQLVLLASCVTLLSVEQTSANKFTPGVAWPDNHGVHINAHGAA